MSDWVFDPKLMSAPPRKKRYPVVDFPLSGFAPKDASVYPMSRNFP